MRSALDWGFRLDTDPLWQGDWAKLEGFDLNPVVRFYEYQEDIATEGLLDWIPYVTVEEKDGIVRVGGFSAAYLANDIQRLYKTSKIPNNIFIDLNRRSFTCYSFFVVEILFILSRLLETPKKGTSNSILKSIMTALVENTWVNDAMQREPLDYDINIPLKRLLNPNTGQPFSFLPNQRGFIEDYAVRVPKAEVNGNILHSPPGTGKTMTGYAFHCAFKMDVTIYVVPLPTLINVWEKELHLGWVKTPKYWTSSSNQRITGDEEIIVCHYEALDKVLYELPKFRGKRVGVWLDESHNFVESASQRTEKFINMTIALNAEFVIWASGTPLKALGKEVVPILRSIDRKRFTEPVAESFKRVYGMSTTHALEILNHRIQTFKYTVLKSDIVNNEMQDISLAVKIPNESEYYLDKVKLDMADYVAERFKYYTDNERDIVDRWRYYMRLFDRQLSAALDIRFREYQDICEYLHKSFNPKDPDDIRLLRVRKQFERDELVRFLSGEELKEFRKLASVYTCKVLVVRGEALGRILTRKRIDCFVAMANHAAYDTYIESAASNTIIFTNYIESAKVLHERFRKQGYDAFIAIGETSNDLKENLEKLRNRRGAVIVATYKSLGVGVPVTMCNVMIFNDLPFRDYMLNQAKSRIDRIGARFPLLFVTAKLDTGEHKNLAGRSEDILAWSASMVDAMLNLPATAVDYDGLLAD
jgi:hypothetical protein